MTKTRKPSLRAVGAWLVLLVAGCTTQLAPKYDQAIADGLTSVNKDIQTLFASVQGGVTKDSYPDREQTYAQIIGSLNALEIQAKSRPVPDSIDLAKINSALTAAGVRPFAEDKNFTSIPSARAIHDTADTMAHMRDADKSGGLRGAEIPTFQNQANTFLSQAIAYETFIKR